MKSVVVSLFALTLVAGTALAAVPGTTDYLLATQPMISGKVVSANDHKLVVDTDQGEQITLAVDSRTMVPVDLGAGMVARIEFKVTEDGRYIAKRVIPIRDGMSAGRELAYANHGGHAMRMASMPGRSHDTLPQTASQQPLLALLGALALSAAGALALARRFRRA